MGACGKWIAAGLLFTLLGGVGGYAARYKIAQWIGEWLLPKVPPLAPPWDAIIVLSGRPFERSLKAAELYFQAPTRVIALGGAYNDDLLALGATYTQECLFTQEALRALCVPDSLIETHCIGTSTREELQAILRLCRARRWRRIVLVSSPFHGRRITELAERLLSPVGVVWGIAAARPLHYRPEAWWHTEAGLLTVWEELAKVWYYRLSQD